MKGLKTGQYLASHMAVIFKNECLELSPVVQINWNQKSNCRQNSVAQLIPVGCCR